MRGRFNMTSKKVNSNLVDLKAIVEQSKKYEEVLPYTLSNGMDIEYFPHFSKTKLDEIIEEYQRYAQSEDKEDKKFMEVVTKDDTSVVLFWQFLAVKKFTHFGEQMKKIKKVSSLAPYFNALLETGILQEIANEVFDFNEMNKVNKLFANQVALITAVMEYTEELDGQLETYRDKFKETLQGNIDA